MFGGWKNEEEPFRTVVSGEWETGRMSYSGKMFGWATKI